MELEILLIIGVFGGILAVSLYLYLFRGCGRQTQELQTSPATAGQQPTDIEALAERVLKLIDKVDVLENNLKNIEDYLGQKVETCSKKKEKLAPATQ